MARKPANRRAKSSRPARPDGVIARIADRAIDNPAMSGGLLVMALTAGAIVSNAMFLQAGRHPEPLFATRQVAVPRPVPAPAPVAAAPAVVPLPRSRAEPPAATATAPQPPAEIAAAPAGQTLIADVQRELARRGLYVGAIDGIAGSQTKTAVSAFEASTGLPVTGEASEAVLAALTQPASPAAAPAASTEAAAVAPAEQPAGSESIEPATLSDGAGDLAAAKREKADAEEQARYFRVQAALNLIGYGPVTVDGQPGQQTADAIRRFELDNGLPVTGAVDDALIERLVAIGAMQSM